MNSRDPIAVKLQMMKESIRCLVLGICSFLPVIGAGCAPFALWYSFAARQKEKQFWNPAKPHRIVGLLCAAFGALLWSVVDTIWIYHILNNYINA